MLFSCISENSLTDNEWAGGDILSFVYIFDQVLDAEIMYSFVQIIDQQLFKGVVPKTFW